MIADHSRRRDHGSVAAEHDDQVGIFGDVGAFGFVRRGILAPDARCSDLFYIVLAEPVGKFARRPESLRVMGLYNYTDLLYRAFFHRVQNGLMIE